MPGTDRGRHPDLDSDGDLLPDVDLPVAQRDHSRRMADPSESANYFERLRSWQERLPPPVQEVVSGRQFDSVDHYRQSVARAMDEWGAQQGAKVLLTDSDVADMTLEQYDVWFDDKGRPRPGVGIFYQRGVRLDDRHPRGSG